MTSRFFCKILNIAFLCAHFLTNIYLMNAGSLRAYWLIPASVYWQHAQSPVNLLWPMAPCGGYTPGSVSCRTWGWKTLFLYASPPVSAFGVQHNHTKRRNIVLRTVGSLSPTCSRGVSRTCGGMTGGAVYAWFFLFYSSAILSSLSFQLSFY